MYFSITVENLQALRKVFLQKTGQKMSAFPAGFFSHSVWSRLKSSLAAELPLKRI